MSEWQEVRLGTIVESVSETFKFTDKQVVFLNTSDILADKFLHADLCDPKTLPGQAKKRIKKGDLLFSEIRPANKRYALVNFDSDDYVVSTKLMVLRSKGNIDPTYLKLFLTSEETLDYLQMIAEDRSGTFPQITFDILDRMELMVPPLQEQKAIASVLSSLDDKIDLLHRQNTTLERMAETLFRQWFVEEAQEDWVEVKLGDFVGINKKSINKSYPFSQIEYLDTGSLTEGKVDSLQPYMINEAPSRALRLVEHNDVLISTVRPNQKHYGIINNPIENLVVSSGFCVLTCTKIAPHFVYLLLTNNEMTEYLHSIAEGSTSTYTPSSINEVRC